MSYSNVPGYVPAPTFKPARNHRFALATRVLDHGSVVTESFRTEAEAKRRRTAIMRRNEWVSPVLERSTVGDWIPVNPKLAARHAMA